MKRLKDLEAQKQSGELEKFTTREQIKIDEEIEKLEYNIGGIRDLTSLPDAVFIIDAITDEVALKEAIKLEIPIIATCDTNADPEKITYPIPANDDAIKTIEYFCSLMSETINENQSKKVVPEKSISKSSPEKTGAKEKKRRRQKIKGGNRPWNYG